ncbi:MAG: site-2 protease family protein [Sulfolobales archaeon]
MSNSLTPEQIIDIVAKHFIILEEISKSDILIRLKVVPRVFGETSNSIRELYREIVPRGYHVLLREQDESFSLEIYRSDFKRASNKIFLVSLVITVATVFITSYMWIASTVSLSQDIIFLRSIMLTLIILIPLAIHELGHYIVSRVYKIPSTIPIFIPGIPGITLGTFGAVIFARSLPPTLEELGLLAIAGPLGGVIFSIIFAYYGLSISQLVASMPQGAVSITTIPLIFILLEEALFRGGSGSILLSPEAMAAYYLLLIHFINLLPVGQLDGGQVLRSFISRRAHALVGLLTVVIFLILSVISRDIFIQTITLFILLMYILTGTYPHQGASYDRRIMTKKSVIVFILWITLLLLLTPIVV